MYILETNSFKYYLGERLLFKLPALKLHTKSQYRPDRAERKWKNNFIRVISRYKTNSCSRKNHLQNNNDYTTSIKKKDSPKVVAKRLKPTSCRRSNNNPVCCWQTNQLIILIWTICYGLKRNFGITQEP